MDLEISTRKAGNVTILDLHGRIMIGVSSESFKAELRKLIETVPCDLLVNLAGVIQIDSSGLSALVRSYVTLTRNGGNLKILSPTGYVREVLRVTHLDNSFSIFTDEAKALESFRRNAAHA